jgi:hypothetical protein
MLQMFLKNFKEDQKEGEQIFDHLLSMYESKKTNVSSLTDFVQFASFNQLENIITPLMQSDSFKQTNLDGLICKIFEKYE